MLTRNKFRGGARLWGFVFLMLALPFSTANAGYITPFPDNDIYRIYVIGDSLGKGIFGGLYRAFRKDGDVRVFEKTRSSAGLLKRSDSNVSVIAGKAVEQDVIHIAVVLFGTGDRGSVRVNQQRKLIGTSEWRNEYGRRVDEFIKVLQRKTSAIYWVGMPVMRSPKYSRETEMLNGIFRERAYQNGIRFVDTWKGFEEPGGGFSPFGPDLAGKIGRLRDKNGVHFTVAGYRKLASFVEREIRRDLSLARVERDVPLAGTEDEQARVRERVAALARQLEKRKLKKTATGAKTGEAVSKTKREPTNTIRSAHSTISLFVRNENGEEKSIAIKLLRPELPKAVVAHVQRRSRLSRTGPGGYDLSTNLTTGATVISSVSAIDDRSSSGNRNQLPVTQTPYYKVLVKGEKLPPKVGRADDFRWPRPGTGTQG